MYLNRNKKGFTLAEVLIVIVIIGIIAAITLPTVINRVPTKEEELAKKANYVVEQITEQMYEDDVLYPKKSDYGDQGFQNLEKVTVVDRDTKSARDYLGNTKFCQIFAEKFVKMTSVDCRANVKTFTANDGSDWYLPVSDFSDGYAELRVDVNGADGPNCGWDTTCSSANSRKRDQFKYYVKANGKITYDEHPFSTTGVTYKITVVNSTKHPDGRTMGEGTGSVGGSWKICTLKEDGRTCTAAASSNADAFKNLAKGKVYLIQAVPKAGYHSNWSNDRKKVRIINSNREVNLIFSPIETHCIRLEVSSPFPVSSSATYKIKRNCRFVQATSSSQDLYEFERECNSDGICSFGDYTRVAQLPSGASVSDYFTYQCDSTNQIDMSTPSTPTSRKLVEACGLHAGEYQIEVIPASGKTIQPGNQAKYIQNAKLGTDDLEFTVRIR